MTLFLLIVLFLLAGYLVYLGVRRTEFTIKPAIDGSTSSLDSARDDPERAKRVEEPLAINPEQSRRIEPVQEKQKITHPAPPAQPISSMPPTPSAPPTPPLPSTPSMPLPVPEPELLTPPAPPSPMVPPEPLLEPPTPVELLPSDIKPTEPRPEPPDHNPEAPPNLLTQ